MHLSWQMKFYIIGLLVTSILAIAPFIFLFVFLLVSFIVFKYIEQKMLIIAPIC